MKHLGHNKNCPRCGSRDIGILDSADNTAGVYVCLDCDHEFEPGPRVNKPRDKSRSKSSHQRPTPPDIDSQG
jgi:DNA-directed RNA polymerase subunit RPC12/RpoP